MMFSNLLIGFNHNYIVPFAQIILANISLNVPIFYGLKTGSQIGVSAYSLKQTELGLESLKHTYKKDIKWL